MNQTSASLQAVLDAPEEDAPRLVHADALLEQNASRGELIALQIRLAREQHAPSDRDRLLALTRTLVQEHTQIFSKRYAALDAGCVFRRGFIEQVTAPAAALIQGEHLAQLMCEEPVRELVLLDVSDASIRILTRSPILERLSGLICRGTLTEAGAAALAACHQLDKLTLLDLAGTRIGGAGCAAIADSLHLAPTVVALNTTGAGDDGAEALAHGRALRRCRRLLLSRNRIGRRGGGALATSPCLTKLEQIALLGNDALDSETTNALRVRFGRALAL